MGDILAEICAVKRDHVKACMARRPMREVMKAANDAGPLRGFHAALAGVREAGGYGLIAEIKRASPSAGLIRPDFAPEDLASAYERGGAVCLSVLTDVPYFQGSDDDLVNARGAAALPVLRKDFMVDPYQIAEARALGADCVLLILAALDDGMARELEASARSFGMDVLIEVHDEAELGRALGLRSPLIGINNRNLKTLKTDLATTEALASKVPADRLVVSESGLHDRQDLARIADAGVTSFLIGESLMRQADVEAATRALLASPALAAGSGRATA
ncbi:MAG: indole-3-glycerol phosphate synthase TrpC [Proteobacteria bacterium]|nr:indole-3-glycerol phosphate synthase TrpC [Pseudomonadota bacterium]